MASVIFCGVPPAGDRIKGESVARATTKVEEGILKNEGMREEGAEKKMRSTVVCVTGGAGYIGSWLVRKLLGRGCVVHATLTNLGTCGDRTPDLRSTFHCSLADDEHIS